MKCESLEGLLWTEGAEAGSTKSFLEENGYWGQSLLHAKHVLQSSTQPRITILLLI